MAPHLLTRLACASFIALSLLASGAHAAADPTITQPSAEAIQTLIDNHEYQSAVKMASNLLGLQGLAAQGINRYQIQMLKSIAHCGMKNQLLAQASFKAAGQATNDPIEIGTAFWTAELFRLNPSLIYLPKPSAELSANPTALNLMITSQRTQALSALFDDQRRLIQSPLKGAEVSPEMSVILPVVNQLVGLDQLDMVVSGNDDQIFRLSKPVLQHCQGLFVAQLKLYSDRVADIKKSANVMTSENVQDPLTPSVYQLVHHKVGLTSDNKSELTHIVTTCDKNQDAMKLMLQLARSDKGWNAIVANNDRVRSNALDVLNADYLAGARLSDGRPYRRNRYRDLRLGMVDGADYQAPKAAKKPPAPKKASDKPQRKANP